MEVRIHQHHGSLHPKISPIPLAQRVAQPRFICQDAQHIVFMDISLMNFVTKVADFIISGSPSPGTIRCTNHRIRLHPPLTKGSALHTSISRPHSLRDFASSAAPASLLLADERHKAQPFLKMHNKHWFETLQRTS